MAMNQGRKPFWPGKFGTSKASKTGMPKPKSDFSVPEEIGMKKPPMPKRFMAEGGMNPGEAPQQTPPDAQDPDMDGDQDQMPGATPAIDPIAVNFHPGPRSCSLCEFMGPDGTCAVLQMPVSPDDSGCNAFKAKEEGGGDMGGDQGMGTDPNMGAEDSYGGQ